MMACPKCQSDNVKCHGTYTTLFRGRIQRYKCLNCINWFSDHTGNMSRIPDDKRIKLLELIESGESVRGAAKMVGVHAVTAALAAKVSGLDVSKKQSKGYRWRDRAAYFKKLGKEYKVTQYQRLKVRDKIHGTIALWLAKNDKPQSVDKIYDAVKVQWPWLKKSSVLYMLRHGSWGYSKAIGDKFTYEPPPCYFPAFFFTPGHLSKYPEMDAARAVYFQRRGITDIETERVIESLKRENEEFIRQTHAKAIEKAAPQLRMMATALGIAEHYENGTNRSH